ncbi:MAG: hypothetical protein IJX39_00440 [Clostridia bacterium]|nr:hypothetical protein [Clostridia bacterium]
MKRTDLRLPALVIFGIYAVYSCALIPLYQYLSADLVLSDTLWWDIVDFFLNLFEVLGVAASFGFLIHSIYHYGAKKCRGLYILIGGALIFKYVASIIAISIVGGSLDLTADFSSYVVSLLMEVTELTLVILLAHKWISAHIAQNRALKNAAETLGQEFIPRGETLPFRKLFSRTNPLQRPAFWGMIAVTVLRLISFVIGEIAYTLVGYGFSAADIPVILLYWLLLIFIPSFLGYLLALGCILLAEKKKAPGPDAAPEACQS